MRIYVAHSSDIDYKKEVYEPLKRDGAFLEHELILPHDGNTSVSNSRNDYKTYDVVIAECSKPSFGVGIELGWFYDERKPIYCFIKSGLRPSGAVTSVAKEVIKYNNEQDFAEKVKSVIEKELS